MKTKAGTPYYVAPQVLGGHYDEKCDIWSCGVITYILLCGYPPFYGDDDREVLKSVKRGDFEFLPQDWSETSNDAKDFITRLLTFSSSRRPSAAKCLEHPWLQAGANEEGSTKKLAPNLIEKLKSFRGTARLKKMALTYLAQRLQDSDIQDLRDTFVALDTNNDGTLTPMEIKAAMDAKGIEVPEDMEAIIRSLDTDGSNKIEYSEFIAATLSARHYGTKEILWACFRAFDLDDDGYITKEELSQVIDCPTAKKVATILKEVDLDGDERISFEEFTAMMSRS
jgi:calcium-dependent protein kinase